MDCLFLSTVGGVDWEAGCAEIVEGADDDVEGEFVGVTAAAALKGFFSLMTTIIFLFKCGDFSFRIS